MGEMSKGDLLNEDGTLKEAGYAFSAVKTYNKEAINASRLRIKEWDYHFLESDTFGVALTIADNAYMGFLSVTYIDFEQGTYHTRHKIPPFPMGRTGHPRTPSNGRINLRKGDFTFNYSYTEGKRKLHAHIRNFKDGEPFSLQATLKDEPQDSIVVAIPFEERQDAFYYNQKTPGYLVDGRVSLGKETFAFSEDARGILDWGRGVWPYRTTWYWATAQKKYEGRLIALNLGCGFGDTSAGTENTVFIDGKAHKLGDIRFEITKDEKGRELIMKPWRLASDDGTIDLTFTPEIDRHDRANLGLLFTDQHQVFGRFNGTVQTSDETLVITRMRGFAEVVRHRW